jgi:hypothetical protein
LFKSGGAQILDAHRHGVDALAVRDENGTEIFRIDRFRFLYYEPFFNMKNC